MAKQHTVNKSQAQRIHAKRRAEERYGLALNRQDLRDVADSIQRGDAVHVQTTSNRTSVHDVKHKGIKVRVVYDRIRHNVVTFLPLGDNTNTSVAQLAEQGLLKPRVEGSSPS